MKKKTSPKVETASDDEMHREYDFSGGVRGKYARVLKEKGYTLRIYNADGTFSEEHVLGTQTVTLEPDVQEFFPDSKAVNRALRSLISLIPEKRKQTSGNGRKQPLKK